MMLPNALTSFTGIARRLEARQPSVFLDYDDTLTPIVARPDQAVLAEEMRQAVRELAGLCAVAVVSGRNRQDVEALVGLPLIYAGSHGFDIAGPGGIEKQHEEARRLLPVLEEAERLLRERLSSVEGLLVERKKSLIAVHFRNVALEELPRLERVLDEVLASKPGLRKRYGKKVFELQPALDWDKGRAVMWLLEALGLDHEGTLPLYLGDDLTDEDAFRALAGRGIGIAVQDAPQETAARYTLRDTGEVERFLRRLADCLRRAA
jgi:trehalose-phosphatase